MLQRRPANTPGETVVIPIFIASHVVPQTKQMNTNIARCDAVVAGFIGFWTRLFWRGCVTHQAGPLPRRSGMAGLRRDADRVERRRPTVHTVAGKAQHPGDMSMVLLPPGTLQALRGHPDGVVIVVLASIAMGALAVGASAWAILAIFFGAGALYIVRCVANDRHALNLARLEVERTALDIELVKRRHDVKLGRDSRTR